MTYHPKRIVERAIKKALYGGWYGFASDMLGKLTIEDILIRDNPHGQGLEWTVKGHENNYSLIESLIFSRDFAIAIWGEGPSCAYCRVQPHMQHPNPCPEGRNIWPYLWEYHLQQMVIAKDPLEYLNNRLYS